MQPYTEIICILDRSGSMAIIQQDAIGGFNTFLKEQQEHPGKATFTMAQFDTQYEMLYENTDIKDVKPLDEKTFVPRGMTALLDAIGRTIYTVGKRLANLDESKRPAKVIVAILTDGQENSSTEFNSDKIKEIIEHQRQKYSWEFIYLGANQDAFAEANKIGIDPNNAANYVANAAGIRSAYGNLSNTTMNYRTK